jgi:hypothetical protein
MARFLETLRHYAVLALVLGLGSVTLFLGLVDRKLVHVGPPIPREILWGVASAAAILSELTLVIVCAMLASWTPRNCIGFVVLGALLYIAWSVGLSDDTSILVTVVAATALLPLPARLSGKRLTRLTKAQIRTTPRSTHSLRQWFLSIAVIGIWFVAVPNLSSTPGDRGFFVAISLASFFGVSLVLGNLPLRVSALLYVFMLFACGLGASLYLAESLGTMNFSAPPVHGELAPISSPIEFLTTRLAHLQYFDVLDVTVVWLATMAAIQMVTLSALRFAGYRIVHIGKLPEQRELKA